ncbi:RNA polymerase sigma factor [Streptomyces sp. NBC_00233]|uniref:RNA polymerase sigma factor n=1 Tax=Streptomyces sp. NBC_00233 TaxID=2975686 RepID=UPI0022523198|nr:sigma-70 family RNA polymerase sigma factor [Streptomyces sp. NBC_00233]MCX5233473.1 sigma-70 family RNA polymerase sigma factor [Streptomyces sp. NBC_00233]
MDSTTSLCAVRCLLGSSSETDGVRHCITSEVSVGRLPVSFGTSRATCGLDADFTQFVESTRPRLVSWAFWRYGDAAPAEDLVQTAYLNLWEKWADYRSYDPEHKKALAYKTVNRVFIDYKRKKSNGYVLTDLTSYDVVGESDIEAELIATESVREVLQAIEQLPDIFRKLIESVYIDGNTVAVFAESEGLAPKTASRYRIKAMQMLRGLLGER